EFRGRLSSLIPWCEFHLGLLCPAYDPSQPAPPDELDRSEDFAWFEGLRSWKIEGVDDVRKLLASPWLRTITRLWITSRIGPAGAKLLARSPALSRLRYLGLRGTDLGAAGVAALASSAHLSRLRTLSLARNDLAPEAITALANSPHLAGLTT